MAYGFILLATLSGSLLGCLPIGYFTGGLDTTDEWVQALGASALASAVGATAAWYILMRGRERPEAPRIAGLALLSVIFAGQAPVAATTLIIVITSLPDPDFLALFLHDAFPLYIASLMLFIATGAALIFCGVPAIALSFLYFWGLAHWRNRSGRAGA